MPRHALSINRQIYQTVLGDFLEPRLAKEGFRRYADDWFYRWTDDLLSRVSTNFRRDGHEDRGIMDVSVGVGFKSLGDFLRQCEMTAAWCASQKKPGMLGGDLRRFHTGSTPTDWWIEVDTVAEDLAAEILSIVETTVLPFFQRYASLDEVVLHWEQLLIARGITVQEAVQLAATYWIRGEQRRALDVLQAAETQFGARKNEQGEYVYWMDLDQLAKFRKWLAKQPTGPARAAASARKRTRLRQD